MAQSEQNVRQATDALEATVGKEHALVAQVQAQLAEAKLNLEYTKIYAPCDGIITDLQLREGAYAHIGQAVLACIDTGDWVMVANFRENNLVRMQPGQPGSSRLRRARLPTTVQSGGAGVGQRPGYRPALPQVKNSLAGCRWRRGFQVRLTPMIPRMSTWRRHDRQRLGPHRAGGERRGATRHRGIAPVSVVNCTTWSGCGGWCERRATPATATDDTARGNPFQTLNTAPRSPNSFGGTA